MRIHGETSGRVDEIFADAVALFHERIEVVARGMHGNPTGVVPVVGTLDRSHQVEGRVVFPAAMDPKLIGTEIGRVQVLLLWIKDHAVDARVGLVGVVLDILLEGLGGRVRREDGAVAGVVVERVAVDSVRGFVCGEEEDGSCVCRRERGIGW